MFKVIVIFFCIINSLLPPQTLFYIHMQSPNLFFKVLLNRVVLSFMQDVFRHKELYLYMSKLQCHHQLTC